MEFFESEVPPDDVAFFTLVIGGQTRTTEGRACCREQKCIDAVAADIQMQVKGWGVQTSVTTSATSS
jgi:hypothetical protein